jgi:hypothetical protein
MYDAFTSCQDYASQYVAHMAKAVEGLDTDAVAEITAIIEKPLLMTKPSFWLLTVGTQQSVCIG